jgi:hypothetical protein
MKMVKRSQSWFVEKNGSCVNPEGRKERKYLERNGKIRSCETSLREKEREKRSEVVGGWVARLYYSGGIVRCILVEIIHGGRLWSMLGLAWLDCAMSALPESTPAGGEDPGRCKSSITVGRPGCRCRCFKLIDIEQPRQGTGRWFREIEALGPNLALVH